MKAILEFNLPDDQTDYELCNMAGGMFAVLWDMRNHLRSLRKYSEDAKEAEVASHIEDDFFGLLEKYNVNLDV